MIRTIFFLVFLGLSVAFGYVYYAQYFKWRDCFNEQGRCFDADAGVVYLEQSGAIWLTLALLALGAALYQAWRLRDVT
ncbi:hypothetical protein J3R80_00015 [Aliiroseovarius sp. Z3]|uniref:hypothetical protein n=1 Tax=Aliiroseovarius sp. Z3 TaxID=2811402 RepID=UPI0023B33F6C|nr:hypothetical protein [Aliiroseovarius sp. Z3]MDE9448851.1 hypothetical protein [Aliiroseovarius sp. Z3]